jgi:hypothetical protein
VSGLVVVRPETVIVCPGTTRLHPRQWVVLDVGTRADPAWDVALLMGIDRSVRCWTASRHLGRAEAEAAAARYASGAEYPFRHGPLVPAGAKRADDDPVRQLSLLGMNEQEGTE